MRLTEDEYHALLKQGNVREAGTPTVPASPLRMPQVETLAHRRPPIAPGSSQTIVSGSGAPSPYRSKLEARYADQLIWRVSSGEVKQWWYEGIKFRLGATCFFCPDFLVEDQHNNLSIHEVKGFIREDALIKLKVAATLYPCFQFIMVRFKNGQWFFKNFTNPHRHWAI